MSLEPHRLSNNKASVVVTKLLPAIDVQLASKVCFPGVDQFKKATMIHQDLILYISALTYLMLGFTVDPSIVQIIVAPLSGTFMNAAII